MSAFILRRLVHAIPVLILTSFAIFMLLRLVPGDPAVVLAGPDASPEVLDAVRHELGLDQPLLVQYVSWIGDVVRGDLGHSYVSRISVWEMLRLKLPATIELTLASFGLALAVAVPTGIIAGVKLRSKTDISISTFTAIGLGLPNFWIGILLIMLFTLVLDWLPPGGRVEFSRDPVLAAKHLVLPAITLAIPQAAILSRFIKGAVVDILHEDYVRTARAKGLVEQRIVWSHVIRNAMIPIVTVMGMQFGRLLGGAVIIESVFTWPGVGRMMLDAIGTRDYALIQGGLLVLVTLFVMINLLTDISYGFFDPRVRH